MIPPEVSHPGHFATAPCGTTLAAYSLAGFEMRFLYAYGSAQAGFSPTKLDTFSVHAQHTFFIACTTHQNRAQIFIFTAMLLAF
jgi:hypothetical protein